MIGKLKLASNKKSWLLIREDGKEMQVPARTLTRSLFPLDPQKHDGLDVEYELDKGLPAKVYEVGSAWQPQSAGPEARGGSGRVGGQRYQQGREPRMQQQGFDREPHRPKLEGEFHNPYNFIPAPPRKTTHPELGDHRPPGHDRYADGLWSGRMAIKLTTQTPLLVLDSAHAETYDENLEHEILPIRVGPDNRPYLPPTSIKGMLRSAYEAVTNSRFSVFEKHRDRLAYRMAARIGPVPARVENRDGQLGLRLMPAAGVMGFAAKLPRYREARGLPRDKGESVAAIVYAPPDGKLPRHGEAVWVQVNNSKVTAIRRRTTPNTPEGSWQSGWVCVTGPNINRKRYERVFLESSSDRFLPIADKHKDLWRELIENYKDEHVADLRKREMRERAPQDYLGDKPGETVWSRHVYERHAEELCEGTLCYVDFFPGSSSEIVALIPVTISRRLYGASPEALLPDSLKPAPDIGRLSPAERVFGWVNQTGSGAYRGNVRIGPARCLTDDWEEKFPNPGLPLAILGQPKAQQARFYAAQSKQGDSQTDGISKEDAGYSLNMGLRGRKVYPHHAGLPEGHWKEPNKDRTQHAEQGVFQEYRRPHKPVVEQGRARLTRDGKAFELLSATDVEDNEQRDDQNRSVINWVRSETVFEFEIDITNLSRVELGALLWLLDLPADHFHRLGGGKPLGFGSVSLAIESTDLREGESWREMYSSLGEDENPYPLAARTCINDFTESVAAAYDSEFEKVSFIAAFKRCAQGFTKPVHYPRALQPGQRHDGPIPPNPEGKAFEWFVANERTGRQGGPKVALPDLVDDEGLPILEARLSKQ